MRDRIEPLRDIICHPSLSPAQKAQQLSVAAENLLPYPELDPATQAALQERVICDLYEGHAPYKPRYVLPDYRVVLENGSEFLELPPPQTLAEAINTLMIAYHHVPSVTGMPVYLGQLDELLLPFCAGVEDDDLYRQVKLFWRYLDRTLPDAFMHANIGPNDNRVARTILRVDAELKQVAPNLTFRYDPQVSGDEILALATRNIVDCGKPHIANHPLHAATFDGRGYGIVSCYNALPLAGGASTLTRLNLKEVARRANSEVQFFSETLPHYIDLNFRLAEARIKVLFDQSHFFDSFLVHEGWIDARRFTAMFGVFAMAEAVNLLQHKAGRCGRYGTEATANALAVRISESLAHAVARRPLRHVWRGRAMLHAQAGLSTDVDTTPGVRLIYGQEPDPLSHLLAVLPHHAHYPSGISDILTLDETIKANPEALLQLCKGALASGMRDFTANVGGNDLVRVTGYMIRLSEVRRYNQAKGARTNTTALGAQALAQTRVLTRQARVLAHELLAGQDQ